MVIKKNTKGECIAIVIPYACLSAKGSSSTYEES